MTHCLTHLRSQPEDANFVWWTLCAVIPKSFPVPFPLLSESFSRAVRARTFVQSCRKVLLVCFCAPRARWSPGRSPLLWSLTTRFFSFSFWRARARASVSAQRWIFKGICRKARFSIRAPTEWCASVLCATGSTCSSHWVLKNKMKYNYISHIVVKRHRCCSRRIHTVSANTKATGSINVSKHLWLVGVYWYVAVCCSVIQHIWVVQVSLSQPLKPFFWKWDRDSSLSPTQPANMSISL